MNEYRSSGPHTQERDSRRNNPTVHSVLAVLASPNKGKDFFKGTTSHVRDGVSTYLALTFGTLLSSQRTEAAFGDPFRPLRAFPSLCSNLSRCFPVGITIRVSETRVAALRFLSVRLVMSSTDEVARFLVAHPGRAARFATTVPTYLPDPGSSNQAKVDGGDSRSSSSMPGAARTTSPAM